MPYIIQSKRDKLQPAINALFEALREMECDDPSNNNCEGNINYIFTKILHRHYPGNRYSEINDAVGVLECCKQEYYRRVAAPLEDQKCYENSDVYDKK